MYLCYENDKPKLDGYADVDMTGNIYSRKSTSEYMMTLQGKQRHGKNTKYTAISIIEAEYIAILEA